MKSLPRHLSRLAALAGAVADVALAGAAVLPDDRADLFWSQLQGAAEWTSRGESVLVRKKFAEQFCRAGQLLRRQGQRRLGRRS